MNEPCHAYERVMSRIWISPVETWVAGRNQKSINKEEIWKILMWLRRRWLLRHYGITALLHYWYNVPVLYILKYPFMEVS